MEMFCLNITPYSEGYLLTDMCTHLLYSLSPGPVHTPLLEQIASASKNPEKYLKIREKQQVRFAVPNKYREKMFQLIALYIF